MCGIGAYKGKQSAGKVLLETLRVLEYRGYDSAGIATTANGVITARKGVGKVDEVQRTTSFDALPGTTGIAHTRWATTGAVNDTNAHPHVSANVRLAIVHNGIVENYLDLKREMLVKGYTFVSETDTEVILAMIEYEMKKHDLLTAARHVLPKLHGRNTFVILDAFDESIVAAKNGSPLLLGVAPDAFLLASDPFPLLKHTNQIIFLEDNEVVRINGDYHCFTLDGNAIEKPITAVTDHAKEEYKGKHEHFMIKEILEQKHTIAQALIQDKEHVEKIAEMIRSAKDIYIVACGSAGAVGLAATYVFASIAHTKTQFVAGSEFGRVKQFLNKQSLILAISQSGETADTLEVMECAKRAGSTVLSIVNVQGSSMVRISDETLAVHAGQEKSVCSTKAITGQLAIVSLVAYAVVHKYDEGLQKLRTIAAQCSELLSEHLLTQTKEIADKLQHSSDVYIIGRDMNYAIAVEASIKLQEVAYMHAQGFAGGELKHGSLALITKGTPCIVLVTSDDAKIFNSALEVKLRGAYVIGISPLDHPSFDVWIKVPDVAIANIIPVQLLAYYTAVLRGNDVDMPRNLAKCVTVF